ncbi:hypothetical protein BJF79_36675 [Actinomadura sp. CNU-125]|uniref:helix-turn-helix domain-containing protein n=1 Tax=Actinomadura sp. CNU-125 TaxID=1904961 RepID=UPI0009682435|nr:helix-turn-helix domain-containing protein [Actinomadura sp. CNU-125]OLT31980.1 hypothetical protein BJF79_36675 [Actinomadura sp. CNU-125]
MYPDEVVQQALKLSREGWTDREVARRCGVSMGAVQKWRSGTRRHKRGPARGEPYDGRIKRDCPRCYGRSLNSQSYAYLLGVYLGDGHIVATTKGCYRLSLSCCATWPGLIDAAEMAMAAVMPLSRVHRRSRQGSIDVESQSKHWPCLFPQHGPGRKHERKIELANWQKEIVEEYTQELVSGLVHSDGCRSMNRVRRPAAGGDRWYEYPRYFFTNESMDIQGIFKDALDRLGIAWKQANRKNISVARREAVARLDEFVGPKF